MVKKSENGDLEKQYDNDGDDLGILPCAEELIRAVHAKDAQAAAAAIEDAFEILDSRPHVEGEHIESESEGDEA